MVQISGQTQVANRMKKLPLMFQSKTRGICPVQSTLPALHVSIFAVNQYHGSGEETNMPPILYSDRANSLSQFSSVKAADGYAQHHRAIA